MQCTFCGLRSSRTWLKAGLHGSLRLINAVESTKLNSTVERYCLHSSTKVNEAVDFKMAANELVREGVVLICDYLMEECQHILGKKEIRGKNNVLLVLLWGTGRDLLVDTGNLWWVTQSESTTLNDVELVHPSITLITSVERNCLHGSLWFIQPCWSTWGTRVNAPVGYIPTLIICNTYCFSTATMVARGRVNVTCTVHCVSCTTCYQN